MRARTACIIGLGAVLSAPLALAQQQDDQRITGIVVAAETGEPVAGARVRYMESGQEPRFTQTDSAGGFEISHSAPGIVTVIADDFATARRSWPQRGEDGELTFVLTPPATAEGRLVDPVTDGTVEGIVTLIVRHPLNRVFRSIGTDGGAFQFSDLSPGPAIIYTHADRFAPHYRELAIEAGGHHVMDIMLQAEAVAHGVVVDGTGAPVAGARVRIEYEWWEVSGSDVLASLARGNVVTGSDGSFRISGLVPNLRIMFRAELGERLSEAVIVDGLEAGETPLDVLRLP